MDAATYADECVGRAHAAAEAFRQFDQARVDAVVEAAYRAAFGARIDLARRAVEETGMGVFEHKVLKNSWASLRIHEHIRPKRTAGTIAVDEASGITEVAEPVGPILALTPLTNPCSTTIFNALICLKSRNPVLFSPHRAARGCSREAARVVAAAAERAGAPAHAIQVVTKAQTEFLEAVMTHPRLALILATSTSSMVKRAQRCGTPTIGVGPGNVPVYVHASADLVAAARAIAHSKTFDNGVVCASEQSLIVVPDVDRRLRPKLEALGAWFCDREQMQALSRVCFDTASRSMRAEVVGRPAAAIAALAGFSIPAGKRLLIAEPDGIGPDHPLSHEILAPVLAYYVVADHAAALAACRAVTRLGGVGHTASVHCNDEAVVAEFAGMDASRILVNMPATEGALGGVVDQIPPSLTLACGPRAGNVFADNITVDHLVQVRRVARLRPNAAWFAVPREAWLDPAVDAEEVERKYRGGR